MIARLVLFSAIAIGCAFVLGYGPDIGIGDQEKPTYANMMAVGESGPLDGMHFTGDLGPEGKPKDVTDEFVFANGTFVSKECELRCEYPARPYLIRETSGEIDFISNTKCPYKDAEITWQGTVKGDKIAGTAIWIVRRWYWTMTKTFEFTGTLKEGSDRIASAD